jgi:hypothetical protein
LLTHEPSLPPADNATAGIVDGRGVAAGALAADDLTARVIDGLRALAVDRGSADDLAGRVVEGALLRRGYAGHQREGHHGQQNLSYEAHPKKYYQISDLMGLESSLSHNRGHVERIALIYLIFLC